MKEWYSKRKVWTKRTSGVGCEKLCKRTWKDYFNLLLLISLSLLLPSHCPMLLRSPSQDAFTSPGLVLVNMSWNNRIKGIGKFQVIPVSNLMFMTLWRWITSLLVIPCKETWIFFLIRPTESTSSFHFLWESRSHTKDWHQHQRIQFVHGFLIQVFLILTKKIQSLVIREGESILIETLSFSFKWIISLFHTKEVHYVS